MPESTDKTLVEEQKGAFAEKAIVIRFDHAWQKQEIEEAARKAGRSVSNFLIHDLGKRRKWLNRDPLTGEVVV